MHAHVLLQLLALLTLANTTPLLAKRFLAERFAWPLDAGKTFPDGRPLLGRSKTVRGVALSVLVTAACAPLIGLGLGTGAMVATIAMVGDLFSSFCKRRLGLPAGSRAIGLDQIPESLFPLLACRERLSLSIADIGAGVILFFIGSMLLSRLLYRLQLRDRPY